MHPTICQTFLRLQVQNKERVCWAELLVTFASGPSAAGVYSQHQKVGQKRTKKAMGLSIPLCFPTPAGQLWSKTPAQTACLYESTSLTLHSQTCRGQYRNHPCFERRQTTRRGLLSCLRYNYL